GGWAEGGRVARVKSGGVTGRVDGERFRNVAKMATPTVVNIRTEMKSKGNDLTDFFGGNGSPDDLFHRFFGNPGQPDDDQPQAPRGRGGEGGPPPPPPPAPRRAGTPREPRAAAA